MNKDFVPERFKIVVTVFPSSEVELYIGSRHIVCINTKWLCDTVSMVSSALHSKYVLTSPNNRI